MRTTIDAVLKVLKANRDDIDAAISILTRLSAPPPVPASKAMTKTARKTPKRKSGWSQAQRQRHSVMMKARWAKTHAPIETQSAEVIQ